MARYPPITESGDISIREIRGDLTVRDIVIPHFDPFAAASEVLSFDPADSVDATNYSIQLNAAHGLTTGDRVRYSSVGGTAMAGLTSGSEYKVLVVNGTTLMLAATTTDTAQLQAAAEALQTSGLSAVKSLVLHIDAAGATGTAHSLTRGDGLPDTATAASVSSGVISFGSAHGFMDGQAVVYSSSGAVIPGLVNGATYFVSVVDANHIRVSGSRDSIVSYLPDLVALNDHRHHRLCPQLRADQGRLGHRHQSLHPGAALGPDACGGYQRLC